MGICWAIEAPLAGALTLGGMGTHKELNGVPWPSSGLCSVPIVCVQYQVEAHTDDLCTDSMGLYTTHSGLGSEIAGIYNLLFPSVWCPYKCNLRWYSGLPLQGGRGVPRSMDITPQKSLRGFS
jgi:hypothetical protein